MRKTTLFLLPLLILSLSACKPESSTAPKNEIGLAVAGTLAALPQPTIQPTYTPYPTITPHTSTLNGLFCEYEFCIGHPANLAFFDAQQAENPSVYSEGMLASYRPDLFSLVIWQLNHETDDPQFMLELIMQEGLDERRGTLDVNLLGDLITFYSIIDTSASEILPTGSIAAWICGDRAFGWKVYTPTEEIAQQLFEEAIKKFRCQE
ncbi:MAG: hypothetical protein HN392_06580 [Anaerolineae bacterium]|jgi:hypothetical protein|nr:hypothetical protein [Anaerolineae bacterium]MBT7073900.1 hypothetical protein [Anaerolineae bacterium]MBT7782868.1 hypothetical protein [Anaerolineae bacterium]